MLSDKDPGDCDPTFVGLILEVPVNAAVVISIIGLIFGTGGIAAFLKSL